MTPTRRVPTEFDEGRKGAERYLRLDLKLLASIGIIGLPNAGKSTLLSRLTSATPEVGDYPFTTLTPSLGVLTENDRSTVLADIPGIIKGASGGKGLGLKFLRHIERTGMLLWVVDAAGDALGDYLTLKNELRQYKAELATRERIIVLNKIDLVTPAEAARKEAALRKKGEDVIPISAARELGIDRLKDAIQERDIRKAHG